MKRVTERKTVSPARISNTVALAIIGLSLMAQTIWFGMSLSASTPPALEFVMSYLGVAVAPGIAIAFVKFLLFAIRGFTDRRAWPSAFGYLGITLWPALLLLLATTIVDRARPAQGQSTPHLSEQFLAGKDWARDHQPSGHGQCGGSEEFIRGCFTAILERRSALEAEGSPVITYPQISCDGYQVKIDEMRRLDDERVAAMQDLKRPGGIIIDGARHNDLNKQRLDMLKDWKYFSDGAGAAGCKLR